MVHNRVMNNSWLFVVVRHRAVSDRCRIEYDGQRLVYSKIKICDALPCNSLAKYNTMYDEKCTIYFDYIVLPSLLSMP